MWDAVWLDGIPFLYIREKGGCVKQLLGATYTGRGYRASILYNKVRFFGPVQKVSRNTTAVADAIALHRLRDRT